MNESARRRQIGAFVVAVAFIGGIASCSTEPRSPSVRATATPTTIAVASPSLSPPDVASTRSYQPLRFEDVVFTWHVTPWLAETFQADGTAGSGCAPGSGPLPDGEWAVILDGDSATNVSVDLVCWYENLTGRADDMVAAARPACDVAVYDRSDECRKLADRAITNLNRTLRDEPLYGGARLVSPGDGSWIPATTAGAATMPIGGLYWIYVNQGVVTEIYGPFTGERLS